MVHLALFGWVIFQRQFSPLTCILVFD
jgi:hypothetical protein